LVFLYCAAITVQINLENKGLTPLINNNVILLVEKIFAFSMYIYFLIYTLLSLRLIKKYNLSESTGKIQRKQKPVTWLKLFIYSFFISWLINAVLIYAFHLHLLSNAFTIVHLIIILPFFIFFNVIFYFAWENPKPFISSEEKNREPLTNSDLERLKKKTDQLINYIVQEKPYLDPDFSINRLSEQVGISVKDISRAINTRFQQNFSDFINYYRTKEVIETFTNSDKLDTDLVSLALDCGFNSKASFFRIFKKNTGLTPRQYFENIQFMKQELLSEAC
jgi:AraC-like DNA-binding protein